MSRRIDVCGIQMNTDVPDVNGARWKIGKTTDWTSPSQILSLGDVTGRPGATLEKDTHGEHVFSYDGITYGPTLAVVDAAADQLNRMPGAGNSGDVVVYESTPKRIRVRQGASPKADDPEPRNAGWMIAWQLTFVSLDPYKQGLTLHTAHLPAGGTVTVANAGNVAATLSLRATGAGTVTVRQNDSGQVLRTRSSVASGTTFDGTNRRVTTAGGVDIFPMGAPSEWLSVAAASSADLTNLGTAPVDVTWYDLYA